MKRRVRRNPGTARQGKCAYCVVREERVRAKSEPSHAFVWVAYHLIHIQRSM